MKLEEIKDPKLVRRIQQAMAGAEQLKRDIAKVIPSKRIRQRSSDGLNKLEREAANVLHAQFPLADIKPHCMKLELANGCWLTPDFMVNHMSSLHIYEIKGPHAWEDSLVKLKVAARSWPTFCWWLMWKTRIGWQTQRVLP